MKHLLILITVIQLLSCHLPKIPNTFDNLKTAIEAAQKRNVKIFVIFDAFGSPTNYVDKILQDEKIAATLSNAVIVRLMCDDRSKLGDSSSYSVGEINSKLQREITGNYYQPMFCVLNETGTKISPSMGYSNKENILNFIKMYIKSISPPN